MNCPYCGNVMAPGRIEAQNLLQWIPDGERTTGVTRWAKSPNSIVLSKYCLFVNAAVEAHYCKQCKKIVIETEE